MSAHVMPFNGSFCTINSVPSIYSFPRAKLESYMTDCHGFDAEQLTEWKYKEDLCADIISFGWEDDCREYLS